MSDDVAARLEKIADMTADRLFAIRQKLDEAVSDHPFGAEKLNPDEQMRRWLLGRNDPAFWQAMIAERQARHGLNPDQVPKDVIELDKDMQKRLEGRGLA